MPSAGLKARAIDGRGPGLAEILIQDDDVLRLPAQRQGSLAQRILVLGALGVRPPIRSVARTNGVWASAGARRRSRGGRLS